MNDPIINAGDVVPLILLNAMAGRKCSTKKGLRKALTSRKFP